mgnify:CR=1 FL=1
MRSRRWRQTNDIKIQPANERPAIRLGRGQLQDFRDEAVHMVEVHSADAQGAQHPHFRRRGHPGQQFVALCPVAGQHACIHRIGLGQQPFALGVIAYPLGIGDHHFAAGVMQSLRGLLVIHAGGFQHHPAVCSRQPGPGTGPGQQLLRPGRIVAHLGGVPLAAFEQHRRIQLVLGNVHAQQ